MRGAQGFSPSPYSVGEEDGASGSASSTAAASAEEASLSQSRISEALPSHTPHTHLMDLSHHILQQHLNLDITPASHPTCLHLPSPEDLTNNANLKPEKETVT